MPLKRYIPPVIGCILVFMATVFLLDTFASKPSEVVIELKAKVLENDLFQLFYLQEGESSFSEKNSVRVNVKGDTAYQNIKFIIPLDTLITKFRLDVGRNSKQKPMRFERIDLKALNTSFEYTMSESFMPNVNITQKDGQYITNSTTKSYDPFFTSKFNVPQIIETLKEDQPLASKPIAYLIAFVFSLALFISLFLKDVRIGQIQLDPYILAFALIIAVPSLVKLFQIDEAGEMTEKRELTPEPEFAFSKTFPAEYESYFNDNFGLRPTVIKWSNNIKVGLFRDSSKPELVQFGSRGFLFFNQYSVDDGGIYASYSNLNIVSDGQLEKAYQKHAKLKTELAENGITYILGFWPNKHSIYSDYLPFSMKMQIKNDSSLADQVVDYFGKRKMPIFDVRADMLKKGRERQLYCKLDSHWNSSGAYEAYASFCRQTFDALGLDPLPLADFDIKYRKTQKGDLTNLLGIDSITGYYDKLPLYSLRDKSKKFRYVAPKGFPKNTIITENDNCGNDKTVVVFRDSYTIALVQFLSLHFSKVIYVWKSPVDRATVEKIKPDIVILGVVERRLPYLLGTVK